MNALTLAAPAVAAGQPETLRRALPFSAACLADPDHD